MKITFLLLTIILCTNFCSHGQNLSTNNALSTPDTSKRKAKTETVITSRIEDSKGQTAFQNAQIFDSANQSELINVLVIVREIKTSLPLDKIQLKMKDAKSGKEFEPTFIPAENGFLIKVLPETIVNIYVTAKGYTDASANINDIKHDRRLTFELQKMKPSIVRIKVLNVADNQLISTSSVKIKSKNYGDYQVIKSENGIIDLLYDTPDAIEIVATAPGYNSVSMPLIIETAIAGKNYEAVLKLNQIAFEPAAIIPTKMTEKKVFDTFEKGKEVTLENIYFDQSSPVLRPESSSQLDHLVTILNQNPTIKIEIRGHTDNIGDFDLNVKLSRDRCQSVIDYLIQKGINASRLRALGRGPVDAIAPNHTEENRKRNRRVTFIVL